MKSTLSIFILFSFFILFTFPVASAEVAYFNASGADTTSYEVGEWSAFGGVHPVLIQFPQIQTTGCINQLVLKCTNWDGDSSGGAWYEVTYKIGGVAVGTGNYGFNRAGATSTRFVIAFFNDDFDVSGYSGNQIVTIEGVGTGFTPGIPSVPPAASGDKVYFYNVGYATGLSGKYDLLVAYEMSNKYEYYSLGAVNVFDIYRDAYGPSKLNITDEGSNPIADELTFLSSNESYPFYSPGNNTWFVTWENLYGDVININLYFQEGAEPDTDATISFNQSIYTSPDLVRLDTVIENMNSDNYYRVDMYYYNGMVAEKLFVSWNDTVIISNSTDSRLADLSEVGLTLPLNIYGILKEWDTTTGIETVIASTNEIWYNPVSMAPGAIWTDKSNYNISETFYIEFDTNYKTCQIELMSSTFHDLRTMEGPGVGHLGYLFNTPHNFTAYLIEDGVKVDQVKFTVSANEPFLNIWLDSVPTKQAFGFEYYTDNSTDTITGFKPDGSIFFGPVTNLIENSKSEMMGLSSASPAGLYTISLLHEGTDYFNDTIELYSTSEYIYFEGDKYETGDTIKIHSYVTDSRQQIRLSDSFGRSIITWTSSNGYVIPNAPTILYFSLIDNNEYGINVESSIDAGTIRAGNWKIEIIDINGLPLTNQSTYDYATISQSIDEPADASNAMLKIFFSPEGLFLIFTAALTFMGIVAARHPAGGAAGAVIGVGFGCYFGVLPVWLLLLMVITLIVLASISISNHFKGGS